MAAMELRDRLKKLATGVSAAKAARAYVESLNDGPTSSDADQRLASEFEATLEVMFLMAAVDGEVSEVELDQLRGSIEAVADMHAVEGLDTEQALKRFSDQLDSQGWRERLQSAAGKIRTPDGRSFAFRLAAGVAFVDDHVAHAEAAAIDSLAAALEIDADSSQQILREVLDTLFG